MKTDLFNYELPPELIAQHPAERRDMARMMVLHRDSGRIEHRAITDITDYLKTPDVLVLNNTKVIPARVFGHKESSGGKIELLLLEEIGGTPSPASMDSEDAVPPGTWKVLMKASRRPKPGDKLLLCSGKARAIMLEDGDQGEAVLQIETDRPLMEILDEEGVPPLPPYISRKDQSEEQIATDKERYQTVYSSEPGAAAAPTAGLHFTPELLRTLANQGVKTAELTLHVGLGTFRPVSTDDITDHAMHHERYEVSAEAAHTICAAKQAGGRVVAVGSTSVRTLETLGADFPTIGKRFSTIGKADGSTNIFIYPPYEFKVADTILTNFHLPKSTLLMMMSAFAGRERMLHAYEVAVQEKYRFFSYGDCMLIL
ncbi:MAG: tRNA preQ1(34) S-adenosylmethionine ribosyltransferase-isomerase QueA [Kiritimatiellales bacterium]|nr:tRNA preQ1(34) S-adenosylmethionine ribosyltransferase-isomerase QueA [Kiritimatiellales bacterium]